MTCEEFKATYLPLGDYLFRVAWHVLESEDDAKDAVQDLYVKLWNSRGDLGTVLNPKAYATTLLKNQCIDRIRKFENRSRQSLFETAALDPPADKALVERDTLGRVMTLMDSLPQKQRQVLRMRIVEGLEYDQIEQRTGLSQSNLRVLLCMARKTLKKQMSL